MKKIIMLCMLIGFWACNNDDDQTQDPIFCTEELRAGLEVIVKDAVDEMFLTEGVTVIATDNEYKETLENFTGSNAFFGAFERKGTYIITASKKGYITKTSKQVIVDEDTCHVITESVEILLERE